MTEDEMRALPLTVDLMTSAKVLGISRSEAYILVRQGKYPVPTYRVGVRHRVTKSVLLDFLGVSPTG